MFRQREERGFCAVQNGVRIALALEGALVNIGCGVNQIAQDRLLLDDARVMLDVRYLGHAVGERRQVRRAAGGFQVALAVELLGQGHKVDRLLPFAQHDHLCEDAPMLEQKEILRTEMFDRPIQRVVVQQNRSEEHTSELQSQSNLVCRLLLEKKKNTIIKMRLLSYT